MQIFLSGFLHDANDANDLNYKHGLLHESSVPKRDHKGSSKTYVDTIPFIVEKTTIVDPNASFIIT
jgi:hypothetical protein